MSIIDRTTGDSNFAHCVRLLGACAAWANTIEIGHVVEHNDRNMIAIPVEIALAFAKERAVDADELGRACQAALDLLASLQAVDTGSR